MSIGCIFAFTPGNQLTLEASTSWIDLFISGKKDRKEILATEQTTFTFLLSPRYPFSVTLPSTGYHMPATPLLFCSTSFSQRGEAPQAGRPLCLPGILSNTVFLHFVDSLSLVPFVCSCPA